MRLVLDVECLLYRTGTLRLLTKYVARDTWGYQIQPGKVEPAKIMLGQQQAVRMRTDQAICQRAITKCNTGIRKWPDHGNALAAPLCE